MTVTVIRKDTNENVRGGCVKYGSDIDTIERTIYSSIKKDSTYLSTKPLDWNSKTRKLLAQVDLLQNYHTGFIVQLQEQAKQEKIEEFLEKNYADFLSHNIEETKDLIKKIIDLTANERKLLLISNEEVYQDSIDPWNLDELCSREAIFHYFIDPSSEEIKLHKMHREKFEKAVRCDP